MKKLLLLLTLLLCAVPAHAQLASVTLEWTAPGDDGDVGTATRYEARWSNTQPDTTSASAFSAWWIGANVMTGLPVPQVAGTVQTAAFAPGGGLFAGRSYYFVLVAYDDANNVSPFSNVAWIDVIDTVPPGCPCVLRLRVP